MKILNNEELTNSPGINVFYGVKSRNATPQKLNEYIPLLKTSIKQYDDHPQKNFYDNKINFDSITQDNFRFRVKYYDNYEKSLTRNFVRLQLKDFDVPDLNTYVNNIIKFDLIISQGASEYKEENKVYKNLLRENLDLNPIITQKSYNEDSSSYKFSSDKYESEYSNDLFDLIEINLQNRNTNETNEYLIYFNYQKVLDINYKQNFSLRNQRLGTNEAQTISQFDLSDFGTESSNSTIITQDKSKNFKLNNNIDEITDLERSYERWSFSNRDDFASRASRFQRSQPRDFNNKLETYLKSNFSLNLSGINTARLNNEKKGILENIIKLGIYSYNRTRDRNTLPELSTISLNSNRDKIKYITLSSSFRKKYISNIQKEIMIYLKSKDSQITQANMRKYLFSIIVLLHYKINKKEIYDSNSFNTRIIGNEAEIIYQYKPFDSRVNLNTFLLANQRQGNTLTSQRFLSTLLGEDFDTEKYFVDKLYNAIFFYRELNDNESLEDFFNNFQKNRQL